MVRLTQILLLNVTLITSYISGVLRLTLVVIKELFFMDQVFYASYMQRTVLRSVKSSTESGIKGTPGVSSRSCFDLALHVREPFV
jgi:hypothetical protein